MDSKLKKTNSKAAVSPNKYPVSNATVVHLLSEPTYRTNKVDISGGNVLVAYKVFPLKGSNTGGIRVEITHLKQKSRRCKVDITSADFEIETGYFGLVNEGIA